MAEGSDVGLALRLTGVLELCRDGVRVVPGGAQQQRLLAVLALAEGSAVSDDQLVAEVWPGDPVGAHRASLQAYVSRLRSLLGGERPAASIVRVGAGYRLELVDGTVDVRQLERDAHEGRAALLDGRSDDAARLLAGAVRLYRGPLLSGLDLADVLADERQRLATLHEELLDALHEAELLRGRHGEVLPALRERVALSPLREAPYRQLMLALERSGRQAEALAVYAQARRTFVDQLGAEPGRDLQDVHQRLLREPPASRPGSVPAPVNALLGRDEDLRSLRAALARARLVTVTGPAGAGKTRLAVEVARAAAETRPDGAWVVELAGAVEDDDVARTVALVLQVLEQPGRSLAESVADAVSARSLLLVLDNCEHVVGAAAELCAALLARAPQVQVLATSQEPLRVDGEHVHRLGPLGVPEPGAAPAEALRSPAARLFVERARAARAGFTVGGPDTDAVVRICRELDGLPLALELAAAALRAVDVQTVAARLPDRLVLLARGRRTGSQRHQSLRAALDWGYELLEPSERALFHQLSVFSGGFDMEALEAVCRLDGAPRGGLLAVLTALIDKSFVQHDAETGRYSLLESLRLYAAEALAAHGGEHDVRRRHADHVLDLCRRASGELRGRHQRDWVDRLDRQREDVAAVLRWSLQTGEPDVGLGVLASVWWYWWRNGHIPAGAQWADQLLAAFPEPSETRAAALLGAAHLWWKLGDFPRAAQAGEQVLQHVEGPSPLTAGARGVLAMVARDRGDRPAARALLQQALDEHHRLGERWGQAATLNMLVSVDRDELDLAVAEDRLARSTVLFDELGDLWGQAWSSWLAGRVATRRGEAAVAAASLRHSVVLSSELRHAFGVVLGLAGLAGVAAAVGDHAFAARMLGATEAYEQAMGVPVRAIEREDSARDVAVTRAALGDEQYREQWVAGFRLPRDRAVGEALSHRLTG